MAVSLNGLHGEHVANLVEEEHQSGLVSVIVRLRPLVANNVLARHWNLKTATPTSAQWMVAGRDGPTGQCVTRLAGVANNPELVFVTVQPLPMAENHVLGSVRKTVRVMTSPVQLMVNGLNGQCSRAIPLVDQDNEIEQEPAANYPPQAAELTAQESPWKL